MIHWSYLIPVAFGAFAIGFGFATRGWLRLLDDHFKSSLSSDTTTE